MNVVLFSIIVSANPFNPEFGFSIRNNFDKKLPEIVANLGDRISFYKTKRFNFLIDALSTNTLLHNGEDSFRLLFSDFLAAPTISFKDDSYFFELKYSHISSHLGDGLTSLLMPGVFSKDFVTTVFDYNLNILFFKLRKHLEIGYAHKRSPDEINKFVFNTGGTIEFTNNPFYISYEAFVPSKNGPFTNVLSKSVHVGFTATDKFRAAIMFYNGYEYRGQIFKDKLNYIGAGLFYKGS